MGATQQIFISYAREDSKSKEAIFDLLVNNLDLKQVRPWKDDMIPAGQYEQTIHREIRTSDFYILLISKSFTSSAFILNNELPLILEESKKGKIIIPIILKDYSRGELSLVLPQISKFQFFPRKEKNLAAFTSPELAWSQLTNDIQYSFYGHLKKSNAGLRYALISLLGVCGLLSGYLFLKPKSECPKFRNRVDLKTLIFPVDNSQNNIEKTLDIKFIKACQKYKIDTDNKFIKAIKNQTLSSGQQIEQAKKCGGDLILSGTLQKINGEDYYDGFFHIVNDTILLYTPTEQLTENELVPISLNSLIQSTHLNQAFDQLIQTVLGFICYKKGDYPNAILAMRAGRIDTMKNSNLRFPSYQVLTDAYYQTGLIDSSLSCLNKLEKWSNGDAQVLLKKSILATEAKQYTVAIESYTKLLTKDIKRKDLILEKRGDLLVETKDYGNAIKDYEASKSKSKNPERLNEKIKKVDTKIINNQNEIDQINSPGGKLTNQQLLYVSDLHLQNGDIDKAKLVLDHIEKPVSGDLVKLEQLQYEVMLEGRQIKTSQIPKDVLEKSPRLKSRALVR